MREQWKKIPDLGILGRVALIRKGDMRGESPSGIKGPKTQQLRFIHIGQDDMDTQRSVQTGLQAFYLLATLDGSSHQFFNEEKRIFLFINNLYYSLCLVLIMEHGPNHFQQTSVKIPLRDNYWLLLPLGGILIQTLQARFWCYRQENVRCECHLQNSVLMRQVMGNIETLLQLITITITYKSVTLLVRDLHGAAPLAYSPLSLWPLPHLSSTNVC